MLDNATSAIAAHGSPDLMRIADALAIGLAMEFDPTIGERIRASAGRPERPLILKLPNGPTGIEIGPSGRLRLVRRHGAANGEEMDQLLSADLKLRMQVSTATSRDHAAELLAPLTTPGTFPSRSEFQSVFRWSALIEAFSCALGADLLTRLDHLREPARTDAYADLDSSEALHRYYAVSHIMAHFALISSDATAECWPVEIAKPAAWHDGWTPTLVFTRERTIWLAGAAAKSAAALGPAVVESYVRALGAARHAFRIFDALFGLAAIALRHEDVREEVLNAVTFHAEMSARRPVDDMAAVVAAFRSAVDLLKSRPRERLFVTALARAGWRGDNGGDGLASPQAFRLDPMEIGPGDRMLGFGVLPAMLSASPAQHYPRSRSRVSRLKLRENEMSRIMRRAWPPS